MLSAIIDRAIRCLSAPFGVSHGGCSKFTRGVRDYDATTVGVRWAAPRRLWRPRRSRSSSHMPHCRSIPIGSGSRARYCSEYRSSYIQQSRGIRVFRVLTRDQEENIAGEIEARGVCPGHPLSLCVCVSLSCGTSANPRTVACCKVEARR